MTQTVDQLSKVTLQVTLRDAAGDGRCLQTTVDFSFVCGTASSGLSPFEYALLGKTAGAAMHLSLPRLEIPATLAHLALPLRIALGGIDWPAILALEIRVKRVEPADPREIIRAMAQAANQEGCGGDCDCGCGGH
jgi:hypothetical protein